MRRLNDARDARRRVEQDDWLVVLLVGLPGQVDAGGDVLDAASVARTVVDEVRPLVARLVASNDSAALLDGTLDAELSCAIEADARRAGFASGLRVAPPFSVGISSPTIRRAQDAARARRQLETITADAARRDAGVDALRASLADGQDRAGAIRYSFVSNRQDEFPTHDEILDQINRLEASRA